MRTAFLLASIMMVRLIACTSSPANKAASPAVHTSKKTNQTENKMTNTVSIIEIPVTDFLRAKTFYEIILDITIEEAKMDGVQMGILPGTEETVHVVLAKGKDYQPAITGGPLLYLNAGNNLQAILDKIKQHGGQEIQPKTEISTEMGVFALFTDTEGNKLGLHAAQ